MIDDPIKTQALMSALKDHVPLTANLTPELKALLRRKDASLVIPAQCQVIEALYMGEEGGICCRLDLGGKEDHNPTVVSITHLRFTRNCPLSQQIFGYQKHRVKKLKKQNGRGF
ncbi:MAG: hypothetical protein JXQ89_23240 [Pelagimonas sp.]